MNRESDEDTRRSISRSEALREFFSSKAPLHFGFFQLKNGKLDQSDNYETEFSFETDRLSTEEVGADGVESRNSAVFSRWVSNEVSKLRERFGQPSLSVINEEFSESYISRLGPVREREDPATLAGSAAPTSRDEGDLRGPSGLGGLEDRSAYVSHLESANNFKGELSGVRTGSAVVDAQKRLTPSKYPHYNMNFESGKPSTREARPPVRLSPLGSPASSEQAADKFDTRLAQPELEMDSEPHVALLSGSKGGSPLQGTRLNSKFNSFKAISQEELRSHESRKSDRGAMNIDYRIDSFKNLEERLGGPTQLTSNAKLRKQLASLAQTGQKSQRGGSDCDSPQLVLRHRFRDEDLDGGRQCFFPKPEPRVSLDDLDNPMLSRRLALFPEEQLHRDVVNPNFVITEPSNSNSLRTDSAGMETQKSSVKNIPLHDFNSHPEAVRLELIKAPVEQTLHDRALLSQEPEGSSSDSLPRPQSPPVHESQEQVDSAMLISQQIGDKESEELVVPSCREPVELDLQPPRPVHFLKQTEPVLIIQENIRAEEPLPKEASPPMPQLQPRPLIPLITSEQLAVKTSVVASPRPETSRSGKKSELGVSATKAKSSQATTKAGGSPKPWTSSTVKHGKANTSSFQLPTAQLTRVERVGVEKSKTPRKVNEGQPFLRAGAGVGVDSQRLFKTVSLSGLKSRSATKPSTVRGPPRTIKHFGIPGSQKPEVKEARTGKIQEAKRSMTATSLLAEVEMQGGGPAFSSMINTRPLESSRPTSPTYRHSTKSSDRHSRSFVSEKRPMAQGSSNGSEIGGRRESWVSATSNRIIKDKLLQEIYHALVVNGIISEYDDSDFGDLLLDIESVLRALFTLGLVSQQPPEEEFELIQRMFVLLDPQGQSVITTRNFTIFILAIFGVTSAGAEPSQQTAIPRRRHTANETNKLTPRGKSFQKPFNGAKHSASGNLSSSEVDDLSELDPTELLQTTSQDLCFDARSVRKVQLIFRRFRDNKTSFDKRQQLSDSALETQPQRLSVSGLRKAEGHRQKVLQKAVAYAEAGRLGEFDLSNVSHSGFLWLERRVKELELADKRLEKENTQFEECTFKPAINERRPSRSRYLNQSSCGPNQPAADFSKKGVHSCLRSPESSTTVVKLEVKIAEGVVEQLFLYKSDVETVEQKISRLTKKHGLDSRKSTKLKALLESQFNQLS